MRALTFTTALCLSALFSVAQCGAGELEISISIFPDQFPSETSWDLVGVGINYASGLTEGAVVCVPEDDCLTFQMHDSFGDGNFNEEAYTITVNGELFDSGSFDGYEHQVIISCWEGGVCDTATEIDEGSYTAANGNHWYTFTPEQNGMYLVSTCADATTCDTRLWIYDYCNMVNFDDSNEAALYFDDNEGGCGELAQINALMAAGSTYWVRIGSTDGDCGTADINWSIAYNGQPVGCTDEAACNYSPLAEDDDGSCIYPGDPACNGPDLIVLEEAILNSLSVETMMVNESDCYIEEGCLNGYGERELVRFTTHIKNIGDIDYYIGPAGEEYPGQFEWGDCHNHWHYEGYAAYMLADLEDNLIPIGFKNGFCVLDLECSDGGTAQYGCGNMGISAHCGDIYGSGLSCQWIDVTDVEDGTYKLGVLVNWDHTPDALGRDEMSYENNYAQVCLNLDRSSGSLQIEVVEDCELYVDCTGEVWGNAQVDCNGDCNGTALAGDLDNNGGQELVDAEMYVDQILQDDIQTLPCTDLNTSGDITVADAALLSLCNVFTLAHEHPDSSGIHNKCNFPMDNIVNVFDSVTFTIGDVNWDDSFIDVHVKNPYNRVVGYQFEMSGLQITSVVSIADPLEYPVNPSFLLGGTEVIGLSYQDSSLTKSIDFQPLCRIYFINPESEICIESITDVVNEQYERTLHSIVDGCRISTSVDEMALTKGYQVAPNPMKDQATVTFYNPNRDEYTFVLTDLTGREVFREAGISGTEVRVDRNGLPAGTYQFVLRGKVTHTGRISMR